MKRENKLFGLLQMQVLITVLLLGGACSNAGSASEKSPESPEDRNELVDPNVTSTVPEDLSSDIATNGTLRAVFSVDMDPATISDETFQLSDGNESVAGTVTYDIPNKTAVFAPNDL